MPSTFEYTPKPRPEGTYTSMTDMVKLGEPLVVTEIIDDDTNTYAGETKPRFLVKGRVEEEELLVTVPKGYSRDDFLLQLQNHLAENSDEEVPVRFVRTQGSAYIDITLA